MVETNLFKDRMCKIDKQVRLDYFKCIFLKIFPISDVFIYGDPIVILCEITIDKKETFKNLAVIYFKKILVIDYDQLEINYLLVTTKESSAYLSSPSTSEELAFDRITNIGDN